MAPVGNSNKHLRKKYYQFYENSPRKIENEGIHLCEFFEPSISLIPKLGKNTTRKEKSRSISLMNIDANIITSFKGNIITLFTDNIITYVEIY